MTFLEIVKLYFLMTVVFFAIDIVWLGVVAKNFYRNNLTDLLLDNPNWIAAVIFYLVFVVGILIFAVFPAVDKESAQKAIVYGALFGFFTYATYDMTNLATLKDWPMIVVVVDILWGMTLSASVATFGFFISKWLL